MAQVSDIRNIALVGHSAAGKTTLGEAMLLKAGVTNRLGKVDDGSSGLDHDEESRERKHSVDSTLGYFEHDGKLINFVDTPGMPDYAGQAIAALAGVETAAIVVSAVGGIGVNTRRMNTVAESFGLARMIVINRIDADNVDLTEVYEAVRETFGPTCYAINLPADNGQRVVNVYTELSGETDLGSVEDAHKQLIEAIVETDEGLMEAYMETGSAPLDKLGPAMAKACAAGTLTPVMFTSATNDVGITELISAFKAFAPGPAWGKPRALIEGEGEEQKETPIEVSADGPFIGQVFKITTDPKSHIKYCVTRIHSGTLKHDGQIMLESERKGHRPGHILKLRGGEHHEVPEAIAGDIVAFAKLEAHIGTMVFSAPTDGRAALPKSPVPMFSLALEPKARGDTEKVGAALHRFAEEDPCFQYHRDPETHELLMSGLGELHLNVIRSKMKRYFKLEVETHAPKIPYRETISGVSKNVEYTHKKQSGGAGQFARVFIDMGPQPRGEGYLFEDKIFGGAIDQAFRPSVDKGIREQMKKGVIAGCPVVDVRVALVDGKTHPVDSKDVAFQIAGRQAFKKAFMQCSPMLLEPVVKVEVYVPTDNVGDITRDLAGKRGQILGQDVLPGNQTCIYATVPLAEVANYSSQLKSVTAGQGSYSMEYSHYDIVPPNVQQQVMAAYKSGDDEDE